MVHKCQPVTLVPDKAGVRFQTLHQTNISSLMVLPRALCYYQPTELPRACNLKCFRQPPADRHTMFRGLQSVVTVCTFAALEGLYRLLHVLQPTVQLCLGLHAKIYHFILSMQSHHTARKWYESGWRQKWTAATSCSSRTYLALPDDYCKRPIVRIRAFLLRVINNLDIYQSWAGVLLYVLCSLHCVSWFGLFNVITHQD